MGEPLRFSDEKTEKSKLESQLEEVYKKLCESEKYLRTIIDSSIDGIAVVDEKGKFEFGNESFFKVSGWLKEEIIGQSFMKMIPEDAREFVKGHWQAVEMDHGGVHEIKIMTRDGEIKYLNVASSLVEINGENKVIAIVHDITEKIRLEKKLKESEARYRNLFDNASDSIYCYDSAGYFLDVNKTALELLGCTKEELIGTHISEWITPESLKITQEDLVKRMDGEPGKGSMVLDVIDNEGKHHCMDIRRRIVRQGDKIVVHGIGRDITEKKRLEKELKESEARYRDLFENAIVPMYILDTRGNILKINAAGLQLLGCAEDEVVGTNMSEWLAPDYLKIVQKSQKKRFSSESVHHSDFIEFVRRDGEHRWAETTSRVIKDGDRIIGIHGIGRDITENMRLKHELMRSKKQKKLLYYLIEGTRGGKTRALILRNLIEKSYNAHQLAKILNLDYKTVRHHLDVLIKNEIVSRGKNGQTNLYFLSKDIESDLNEFNREL